MQRLGVTLDVSHLAEASFWEALDRFSGATITVAIAATAVGAVISYSITGTSAQAPTPLKTSWGEPDLQGIWTAEFDTPLQRSAKYADQEFFTEAQRVELDKARSATLADVRAEHGTEADVAGGDNSIGLYRKRTGARARV